MNNKKFRQVGYRDYHVEKIPGYDVRVHIWDSYVEIYDVDGVKQDRRIGVISHSSIRRNPREDEPSTFLYEIIAFDCDGIRKTKHHNMNPAIVRSTVEDFLGFIKGPGSIVRNNRSWKSNWVELVEMNGHTYLKVSYPTHMVNNQDTLEYSPIGDMLDANKVGTLILWDMYPDRFHNEEEANNLYCTMNSIDGILRQMEYNRKGKHTILNEIADLKETRAKKEKEFTETLENAADAFNEISARFGIELMKGQD